MYVNKNRELSSVGLGVGTKAPFGKFEMKRRIFIEVAQSGKIPGKYIKSSRDGAVDEYEFYVDGCEYVLTTRKIIRSRTDSSQNGRIIQISISKKNVGIELNVILIEILFNRVMQRVAFKSKYKDYEHETYVKKPKD